MKLKEIILILFVFLFISVLFFYKTFINGYLPFPGELLISEYAPWKTYSFLGYNPGSIPSKVQYFDVIRQLYPWKTFSIELFKSGQIPLWNPYNFSGSPLLANFQSAVFYPLNFIYLFLEEKIAWSILIFIQTFLAGFFTYLFAREIALSKKGAIFASIAFAFSLFMSVFLEYSIIGNTFLWMPLILYIIEKNVRKISLSLILLPVIFAFSFFAGHIQIFFYVFIFSVVYFLFRWYQLGKDKISLLLFVLSSMFFVGLSAIQLLPTIELINQSARVNQNYQFLLEKLLIQPDQLIFFLSPDFFGNPATGNYLLSDSYPGNALYIGLIPFIFSLFAVFLFKKNPFVKFFLISIGVLLLLIVRTPISEILYKIQIPFLSTSSPNNSIFLLSFSLAILCGFGIDNFLKSKNFKKKLAIIISLLAVFSLIWLVVFTGNAEIVKNNFIYSTFLLLICSFLFLISIKASKFKDKIVILFLIITIFDLFYFFGKFNPFVPKSLIFPDTKITNFLKENSGINRFWGYGAGEISANFATQYNIFSPDGYDPLYPRTYGEFVQSSSDGKIQTGFSNATRSDAFIARGYGESDFSSNKNRLKVLNILGVKYILDRIENATSEKTFPVSDFKLIYNQDGWRVFENIKALPRFFLTTDYRIYNSKEEFQNIFFSSEFNPRKTILLEKNPKLVSNFNHLNTNVKLIKYEQNNILFQIDTYSDQILFLSDVYYPGWKAFIDQQESEILKADYTFRSVIIPKGSHEIELRYEPLSFKTGYYITIISVLGLVIFYLVLSFRILKGEK